MESVRILLAVITLIIFTPPCLSQTKEGNFMVGGSLSYGKNAYSYDHFHGYGFSPSISYFFSDRFAAGFVLPYSFSETTGLSFVYQTIHSYSLGPTLRYYFSILPRWAIFPHFDYTYGWQTVEQNSDLSGDSGTFQSSSNLFRIGLGSTYFVTKTVGLEGIFSWQTIYGASARRGPSVNFGLAFQIYFSRKN